MSVTKESIQSCDPEKCFITHFHVSFTQYTFCLSSEWMLVLREKSSSSVLHDSLLLTKAGHSNDYLKATFLDLAPGLHIKSMMRSSKVVVAAALWKKGDIWNYNQRQSIFSRPYTALAVKMACIKDNNYVICVQICSCSNRNKES